MPLPFFCALCDKPINPSSDKKYTTIHEKCMKEYLESYGNGLPRKSTTRRPKK